MDTTSIRLGVLSFSIVGLFFFIIVFAVFFLTKNSGMNSAGSPADKRVITPNARQISNGFQKSESDRIKSEVRSQDESLTKKPDHLLKWFIAAAIILLLSLFALLVYLGFAYRSPLSNYCNVLGKAMSKPIVYTHGLICLAYGCPKCRKLLYKQVVRKEVVERVKGYGYVTRYAKTIGSVRIPGDARHSAHYATSHGITSYDERVPMIYDKVCVYFNCRHCCYGWTSFEKESYEDLSR